MNNCVPVMYKINLTYVIGELCSKETLKNIFSKANNDNTIFATF